MHAWENCYTQKANQFKLSATDVSGDYFKKKAVKFQRNDNQ